MVSFELNGNKVTTNVPSDTPLLWVLREEFRLLGTKFGCGKSICGACTVLLDGYSTRTCTLPLSAVANRSVETIEYMSEEGIHPVQAAWARNSVPQCGYCQSGQIMQAIGLLEQNKKWTEQELFDGMSQNLCRCGTYTKIMDAVIEAAEDMGKLR